MLAAVIDLPLLIAAYVSPIAILVWRRPAGERLDAMRRIATRAEERRVRWTLEVAGVAGRLLALRVPSPGSWVAGIRRVDVRTGEPPTWRVALVEVLLQRALERALQRLNGSRRARMPEHHRETLARVQALHDELADDPDRLQRETADLHRADATNCLAGMARALALGAAPSLTALLSPRRQTVAERLAGVVVVRDRA